MSEMNGCSVADMAALMGRNDNNAQWNNPMWLIWAILFGGNGFGFGGNRQGVQDAELMGQLNALRAQIADNQNANVLNGAVNNNGEKLNGINCALNTGFDGVNAAINQASMASLIGQKDMQSAMQSCCCDIKSNILNQTNQIQSQIAQLANAAQAGFAQVGFLTQQQTNELNVNANANTQRILDKMCSDTNQALRDKLWEMSQTAQTASIVSQLKTTTTATT